MKPITPEEVESQPSEDHSATIGAINSILKTRGAGGSCVIKVGGVVTILKEAGYEHSYIFDSGMLNVEVYYRNAGWSVVLHRPDYTESFDPYWTFSKRRSR